MVVHFRDGLLLLLISLMIAAFTGVITPIRDPLQLDSPEANPQPQILLSCNYQSPTNTII